MSSTAATPERTPLGVSVLHRTLLGLGCWGLGWLAVNWDGDLIKERAAWFLGMALYLIITSVIDILKEK